MRTITLLATVSAIMLSPGTWAQLTCGTASLVTEGTYAVPTITGIAPPVSCTGGGSAGNGMWYRFQATEDLNLTVTTDLPQNAGKDTRIQIFTGTCGALVCVGGDDDSGSGYLSVAVVGIAEGDTYFIAFDDYWDDAPFEFELTTSPGTPWANGPTFTPMSVGGQNALGVSDMNGDALADMITISGSSAVIAMQQPGGGFETEVFNTPAPLHSPSWSFCVGDINGDGQNDMMYGGGAGATFMIRNEAGTGFTQQGFIQYIFSQRTNMVDIDNDGHLDAFVCHDVDANVRFMNNGSGVLQLIQGGLGETCGNYGSLWTDVNNDGLMDLFVAKCGCDANDRMLLNQGNENFQDVSAMNLLLDNHQSWSSAWGDFDNDGDMDVFIGSSTSNVHKVMENDGNGNFTLVPSAYPETTGTIEWTAHDLDNDGYLDVMGGGRILMGNGDMTFTTRMGAVTNGPVGDLNNDGFLDYVNGGTIMMNNGNENHWLTIVPQGVLSNTNGIGARITVESPLGSQIREIRSGDGFRYMSTLFAHFGLGSDATPPTVTIHWPSGVVDVLENVNVDGTLVVEEGSTINTGIGAVSGTGDLVLHPNPTGNTLFITGAEDHTGQVYQVFDAAGQVALQGRFTTPTIDVSGLSPGVYNLQIADMEGTWRFVKQ